MLLATLTLLLHFALPNNERLERITRRAGICETDELASRAYCMLLTGGPETFGAAERFRTLGYRRLASPHPLGTLAETLAETATMTPQNERHSKRIRAANLFSELGDRVAAGPNLAVVLRATSAFDDVIFRLVPAVLVSTSEILTLLLEHSGAARSYFYDVTQHGPARDFAIVWSSSPWALPIEKWPRRT